MIFDTDVLVWVFRRRPSAVSRLEAEPVRTISIVSYLELVRGVRDKRELAQTKGFLVEAGFEFLPLTEEIGHRASVYMEEYALSTSLDVADALIAATAVEHGLALCTGNVKHYRAINDLGLEPFTP